MQLFGPEDAGYLLHLTGRLIGMQHFDEIARGFGVDGEREGVRVSSCSRCSRHKATSLKRRVDDNVCEIVQRTWKLMAMSPISSGLCQALEGVIEGLAAGCGRGIAVDMKPGPAGAAPFVWSIGRSQFGDRHSLPLSADP